MDITKFLSIRSAQDPLIVVSVIITLIMLAIWTSYVVKFYDEKGNKHSVIETIVGERYAKIIGISSLVAGLILAVFTWSFIFSLPPGGINSVGGVSASGGVSLGGDVRITVKGKPNEKE